MDFRVQDMQDMHKARTKLSQRINGLFVFLFLGVLPLLYFSGYINQDWANRLGIIMNFLAGFLVAPELLGEERLVKTERYLENRFQRIQDVLTRAKDRIKDSGPSISGEDEAGVKKMLPFSLLTILLLGAILYLESIPLLSPLLFMNTICVVSMVPMIFIVLIVSYHNIPGPNRFVVKLVRSVILSSAFAGFFVFGLVSLPFLLLMEGIPSLIITLVRYILSGLAGDNRLRRLLIGWGIILFILGNVLQLISTFNIT
jgi:hypothetical protein